MKSSYSRLFFLIVLLTSVFIFGCTNENKKLLLSIMEMKGKGPGWGHAIVIQTPDGHTWLYDTGSNYKSAGFDAGKDIIAPFLVKNNVKEIDGIVISHAHRDHFGGFPYLMQNFKIKELYDNGYPFTSSDVEFDSIYKPEYIRNGGIYKVIKEGSKLDWGKDLEIKVLSPPESYIEEIPEGHTDPSDHHNPNLNSLVLHIRYKNTVFLFIGDINLPGQEHLIKNYSPEDLKADVICAGHGGAFDVFARVTRPEIVVESCLNGVDGPAKKSKEVYEPFGAKVYATCWNGTVRIESDGNKCTVITERDNNPYQLVYDKELKQYVISAE